MKTIAGILVLVVLVTVVAVSGSRAQPLSGASVAFQQCLEQVSPSANRCASAVRLVAGADEFGVDRAMDQAGYGNLGQVHGDNLSSPEIWVQIAKDMVKAGLMALVTWALDRYFDGGLSADPPAHVSSLIFDPVR